MSLFAIVGFRKLEIRNRVFLSETLREAGAEDGLHSVVFGEHELSIRSKNSKTKIQRKKTGDAVVFLEFGHEILSIANSRFEIPESYAKPFVRCFRHRPVLGSCLGQRGGTWSDATTRKAAPRKGD